MSASSSEDITTALTTITELVSEIARLSGIFIRESTRTARLERAKKILEECEKFLTTLKSEEIGRIEGHQPIFMSNLRLDRREAKTHHDQLASKAAVNPGLMPEARYWGDIYKCISELLGRLEDLQGAIAETSNSHRTVSRFSGSSKSQTEESSRQLRPLLASSSSSSNISPTYNNYIPQRYNDTTTSRTEASSPRPRPLFASSSSSSNTTPTYNYDPLGSRDQTSPSTARPAGSYLEANISLRYPSSGTGTQGISRNFDQETENLSLRSLYISPSGPPASTSGNRQQSSFIPASSTVVSNPVSHHRSTTHYDPGSNPLATTDASTRRQPSLIPPSTTGVLASASQRRASPPSHYDPSFRALATEVDDDSEDVSGQRFSSATARQNQTYRTPSRNFPATGSYNDRGSAEQNYTSGSTSTWIHPSTEDPQRVQRSFSSTSYTSTSSTHQGSSRSGQYTTYRSPQDNTPSTSRESRPVSYAHHRSRPEDYDDDSEDEDEDDDDIYDNRTHGQEWASRASYGGVSAARPHHPVSGGATPARSSNKSWQDEDERQQSQRSSTFYHPPPKPSPFHQQTSTSTQGVTMASASSYAQPAGNYPSMPANTSTSSYAQQFDDNFGRHHYRSSPGRTASPLVSSLQRGGNDNSSSRDSRPMYSSPQTTSRSGSQSTGAWASPPRPSSVAPVLTSGIQRHDSLPSNRSQYSAPPYDRSRQQESIGTVSSSTGMYQSNRPSPAARYSSASDDDFVLINLPKK